MKRKRTALFGALALVFLTASLRADTLATQQWVVTSAKVSGAGGEQFVSSLRIVNPYNATANVKLTFLPQSALDASGTAGGDNSGRQPVSVAVGAGQTLAIDDVIGTRFGSAAQAGGIKVTSDIPISVQSQTLVANARSASGVPGTYGFTIPAQVDDQAVSNGDIAFLPYVSSAAGGATSGYRTNFFMLSTNSSTNSVVNVQLVKGTGMVIGQRDYTLAKLAQTQQNQIAASFGYTAADTNLFLVVTVKSGGPVVVGASVIDNAISSISYTPPVKSFLPNNGSFGLVFPSDTFGLSGRLDIVSGLPNFMTAAIGFPDCGNRVYLMQAFGTGQGTAQDTTFTRNSDGSFTFSGANALGSWNGTIDNNPDGTVSGTFDFRAPAGSACQGFFETTLFSGARSAKLP